MTASAFVRFEGTTLFFEPAAEFVGIHKKNITVVLYKINTSVVCRGTGKLTQSGPSNPSVASTTKGLPNEIQKLQTSPGMTDDMGQIRQDIGSLLQGMKNAENQRTTIFEKLDEYGKELVMLRQDHNALSDKVDDDLEPVVADYKRTKQRGLGILGGIVFAAGGVSAAVTKAIQNIFPNQ